MRFFFLLTLFSTAFAFSVTWEGLICERKCFDIIQNETRISDITIIPESPINLLIYYQSDVPKTNIERENFENIFDDGFTWEEKYNSKRGIRYCGGVAVKSGYCGDEGFFVNFRGNKDVERRTFNEARFSHKEIPFEVQERVNDAICILSVFDDFPDNGYNIDFTYDLSSEEKFNRQRLFSIKINSFLTLLLLAYLIKKGKLYKYKTIEINHFSKILFNYIIIEFLNLQIVYIDILLNKLDPCCWTKSFLLFAYTITSFPEFVLIYQFSINNSNWNETIKSLRWNKFKNLSIILFSLTFIINIINRIHFLTRKINAFSNIHPRLFHLLFKFIVLLQNLNWLIIYPNFKETGETSGDPKLARRLRLTAYVLMITGPILYIIKILLFEIKLFFYRAEYGPHQSFDIFEMKNPLTSLLSSILSNSETPIKIGLLLLIWKKDLASLKKKIE